MTITRFFCPPTPALGNALINWSGKPVRDLVAYAESYRSSACRLVAAHRELQIGSLDHQVLPILFLYRHSFEVFLKAIVYRSAILSISESELTLALPRLWREHSLVRLHAMAHPALQTTKWVLVDIEELDKQIAELTRTIDDIDPGSYSFRYPVTSSGDPGLPKNFLTNIFMFSETIEALLDQIRLFCRDLDQASIRSSGQMKLALHALTEKSVARTNN